MASSGFRGAPKLGSGNFVAKMGAVVEGHAPVTLRVPEAARGRVGLIYGDASRGRGTRLSVAPVEVTFEPCPDRPRSGWVGGLLLDTVREPVTLEVSLTDSHTELLTIEPGPTRLQECRQARRTLEPENARIYERFRRYCARVLGRP